MSRIYAAGFLLRLVSSLWLNNFHSFIFPPVPPFLFVGIKVISPARTWRGAAPLSVCSLSDYRVSAVKVLSQPKSGFSFVFHLITKSRSVSTETHRFNALLCALLICLTCFPSALFAQRGNKTCLVFFSFLWDLFCFFSKPTLDSGESNCGLYTSCKHRVAVHARFVYFHGVFPATGA